ncbi:Short repeat-containing protein of unknown function [Amycolatopsis xylanica]|uniref:Uncharacterized protein n=1 Tax=Amycolatopsis xylanica TaxID=589385 RepID=A0A1H3Q0B2_9PSEU|nr:hypothetical protein [Amycolatopsis xylanica]SDZ06837.1 Short repeat-containing protein of unknown function [Amycolatopsis xylanica]
MDKRSVAAVALLAVLGAGLATAPAFAADPVTGVSVTAALPAWKKAAVRRYADTDARPDVVAAAWNAWRGGDAAIEAFLAPGGGLAKAKARHEQRLATDDKIVKRVLATTTPKSSPAVNAAAVRADRGTFSDKEYFVATGWDVAAAQDADTTTRHEIEVAKQAQADRDYVASLAANDPGDWVRAAAAVACRGDAELADFFAYGWSTAARGDTEAHRVRVSDRDAVWQHQVTTLVRLAEQAETALANADAALVDKAREDALRAWRDVSGLATSAQQGWDAERTRAATQAASWRAVVEFARTATTAQNWQGVSDQAGATGGAWRGEQEWAEAQARQWTALLDSARAAETRVATSR